MYASLRLYVHDQSIQGQIERIGQLNEEGPGWFWVPKVKKKKKL